MTENVRYEDEWTQLELPFDWTFGGADGCDPRADKRFLPASYRYSDKDLNILWVGSSFLSDEEAIDKFTWVATFVDPVYLEKKLPGGEWKMVPVRYDKSTDTAHDI